MKRSIVSRVATAVAFAGIAAAVTACGSGGGNGVIGGSGYEGTAISGQGSIPASPMIQFSGNAQIGPDGGIIATQAYGDALTMTSVSASPAQNAPLNRCTLNGSYQLGRCGAWANLGINLSGNGYPGSTSQISGMIQFNSIAWAYLSTILGGVSGYGSYGLSIPLPSSVPYGYPGGSFTGGITGIQISDAGTGGIGMGVTSSSSVATGGAPYALYDGWVVLSVSGQQNPIVVPF
jgi:hypothetical protein